MNAWTTILIVLFIFRNDVSALLRALAERIKRGGGK